MSKKLIKTLDGVPPWFRIGNYDVLASLSGGQLVDELEYRVFVYKNWKEFGHTLFELPFDDIRSRSPFGVQDDDLATEGGERKLLSGVLGVISPLSYYELEELAQEAVDKGKLSPQLGNIAPELLEFDACRYDHVSADLEGVYVGAKSVLVDINLNSNTDEQIMGAIAQLLPRWRRKLKAPEPPRVIPKVGESTIRKILEHKLIPWLDLEVWALCEGVKINRSLLARILFKDDLTRDGNWISDKTKGGLWFSRAIDYNFTAQLKGFLATQPELAARPVGRYRSRDD